MDSDMKGALTAFAAGGFTLAQTRHALLCHFLGRRTPSDALLLADYVEDVALRVRDGTLNLDDAVSDLIMVRASEDDRRNSLAACRIQRQSMCHAATA